MHDAGGVGDCQRADDLAGIAQGICGRDRAGIDEAPQGVCPSISSMTIQSPSSASTKS